MNSREAMPLRVAVLAPFDPLSTRTWSGTPGAMCRALARTGVDVTPVAAYSRVARWLFAAIRKMTRGRYSLRWNRPVVSMASRRARQRIRRGRFDAVLAVAASPVSALMEDVPGMIHVSDSTPAVLFREYRSFGDMVQAVHSAADAMERQSFAQCEAIHYPVREAADSAIADYGIDPERVWLMPWGANFVPAAPGRVRQPEDGRVNLLFIGVDWDRKGGEVLLECVRLLQNSGIDARADIVGVPASVALTPIPEGTTFHGFLDYQDAGQAQAIEALYDKAHLFVLPTRSEALGIVFAEAAARGLPAIGYAIGGVPTMVDDGKTGILLPAGSDARAFADAIAGLLRSDETYRAMSAAALEKYRNALNWDAWARTMANRIVELQKARTSAERLQD